MLFGESQNRTNTWKWLTGLLLAVPISVSATPIEGAIGFGGMFSPAGGAGNDMSDATNLDVSFAMVTAASGDYAPALFSMATFNALTFSPATTPVQPLWSVDVNGVTYSFSLFALSINYQDADQINLTGSGIVSATGFDDTPGLWTFSGEQSNTFATFSSITQSQKIPAPATLLLLMIGMSGMVFSRYRVA